MGPMENIIISTGSCNGLVTNIWQAITWTNIDLNVWYQMAALGLNDLIWPLSDDEKLHNADR